MLGKDGKVTITIVGGNTKAKSLIYRKQSSTDCVCVFVKNKK